MKKKNLSENWIILFLVILLLAYLIFAYFDDKEFNDYCLPSQWGCQEEYKFPRDIALVNKSNIFFDSNYNQTYYWSVKNITSIATIDCSLPEKVNKNISIIYGEIIKDSNEVEIPFIEFCERLRK